MSATTARDMLNMLQRHYLPEGKPAAGIFAPEIAAPGGKRRADLIFQGCTAAAGSLLIGHEIKVSRADLAAELDDLTKSHDWQRYCHRWYLVIPDLALAEGLTLPETWGVMTPPSGRRTRSMTIAKGAPKLAPDDQAAALRTLSTWLHWRLVRAEEAFRSAQSDRQRAEERARDLAARVPRGDERKSRQHEMVDEIVRRLGGPHSFHAEQIGGFNDAVSIDDVVTTLKDIGKGRDRLGFDRRTLARSVNEFQRLVSDLDRGALAKLAIAADEEAAKSS